MTPDELAEHAGDARSARRSIGPRTGPGARWARWGDSSFASGWVTAASARCSGRMTRRLDRDVAIKILKQPNPGERVMERFFREARAVARLDHPNIVAVHDSGFDGGRCWVAYQLVGGRPLWWYRDHHRMDAVTVARIDSRAGRCARPRAPHGSPASRHQAGERADRRPGKAAADRLRPGAPVRLRVGPDPRRCGRRHAGLHEPGASPRPQPAGRRAERRLQPGRHLLRIASRAAPG